MPKCPPLCTEPNSKLKSPSFDTFSNKMFLVRNLIKDDVFYSFADVFEIYKYIEVPGKRRTHNYLEMFFYIDLTDFTRATVV